MTTTPTTKTVSPRKPQDRQPSKSEQMRATEQPPAGFDLMTPVAQLRSGETANLQADLMDLFKALGIDLADEDRKEVEIETTPEVLRTFGRMGALLEPYTIDLPGFIALDRGVGAASRMADLAMYYLAELGKSESSAS